MTFREMLTEPRALLAPAVFNPLAAKLAEAAGFKVLYLGGVRSATSNAASRQI
jgi:2-methylisocitrate lyase-like PEP mutase family enzyme